MQFCPYHLAGASPLLLDVGSLFLVGFNILLLMENCLQDDRVEGHMLIFSCNNSRILLTAEQPLTGECVHIYVYLYLCVCVCIYAFFFLIISPYFLIGIS